MWKTFKKEDLVELVAGGEVEGLTVVEDEFVSKSGWSLNYRLVFKDVAEGKYYYTAYSKGATESQDERPFEGHADLVACQEVYPDTVIRTVYKLVEEVQPKSPPDSKMGLYQKYFVQRADGTSRPGGKHQDCDYFVLDLVHDPHSRAAALAYARSCKETHPKLSEELTRRVNQGVKFHLYQDDDGNIYAAHTMREAWEVQSDDVMWSPQLEGWVQLPDYYKLTDLEGETKTAAEHAQDWIKNNPGAGWVMDDGDT